MRLYLMRHADAVPHGTPGYLSDAQRPLTGEGRAQARGVASGLKRLDVELGMVLTSPYVRAIQTAEEFIRAWGGRLAIKELDALRSEVDPKMTSLALKRTDIDGDLLLVGHEPHLSAWIAELVSSTSHAHCVMKKAGVACVEIERIPPARGSGMLRWLMTPKSLMLLGGS